MAEILVLVDHADGVVRKPALELLTLARRIGEPSAVVLGAGAAAADIAAKAAEFGRASRCGSAPASSPTPSTWRPATAARSPPSRCSPRPSR